MSRLRESRVPMTVLNPGYVMCREDSCAAVRTRAVIEKSGKLRVRVCNIAPPAKPVAPVMKTLIAMSNASLVEVC